VHKRAVLAVFTTMAIVIAAGGITSAAIAEEDAVPAGTAEVPRDIVITMAEELRFDPEEIAVMAGETVRFVLENPTAAAHDFTIGSLEAQELHNAQMAAGMTHDDEAGHDMEMADDEADHEHEAGLPAPVTIAPGEPSPWSPRSTSPARSSSAATSPDTGKPA